MEDNKITLDFSKTDYSDAAVRNDSDLVNIVQMEKMMELIEKQVQKSKDFKLPESNKIEKQHHVHNTISIFGNRGAGKTTFLQTALYLIFQKYEEEVVLLKVLDPSLLDCKQHPFISIIASIHELVEKCINKDYLNRGNISKTDKDKYDFSYKNLLKGLPFIDGVGSANSYQDWDDDLYVSMQGMEKAEASNNLIDNFIEYVYDALKVLNKKCFIIPFDDIDTNINKGFEILEVIRKYLITEQIITILTGDLDLYSKLVRKASWDSFSKNFLEKERDYSKRNPDEFSHMINHLENQYLLKVLKPEYRIHLKTIREVIESGECNIKVLLNEKRKSPIPIYNCYADLIKYIGFNLDNVRIVSQIIYFIEGLSIRTQMRILKLLSNSNNGNSYIKKDFIHKFINIFWTDIKQKSLDAKSLVNDDDYYPVEMMKFLLDTQALNDCSDFMPHTNDDILNKALLAISAQFTKQVQNSGFMIFDYWVRICYIKYVVESFKVDNNVKVLNEIVKFSSILEHDDLTKCIGLVEAYSRSIYKSQLFIEKTLPGTIIIKDTFIHRGEPYDMFLDIISHGSIDHANNSVRYISLYKLFAVIRDYIFHCSYDRKNTALGDFNIVQLLRKITQYRGYLEPMSSEGEHGLRFEGNEDEGDFFPSYKNMMTPKWYELSTGLLAWSERYNYDNLIQISPQLLNRIFTRTYFTMINIDNDSSYVNLGQKFNAYIIALLNSVLVESSFEFFNGHDIIINNTGKIENVFKQNMSIIKDNYENYKLLKWLIECPLFELFLNPIYYRILIDNSLNEKERKELEDFYYEREVFFNIQSLKEILDEYNQLSGNLIEAVKWTEDFTIKANEKERLIFSLSPLENGIMYFDTKMSNNLIFQKIDKISDLLEKVALSIFSLEKMIKKSESSYYERFSSRKDFIKSEEKKYTRNFEYDFYSYLCNIKIKR